MPVFEQLLEQYSGQIKVVFKQFPLRSHAYADKAARASLAAQSMGKFWQFHDLLFKHHKRINNKKIEEIRAQLELDPVQFEKEMTADHTRARVATDLRNGIEAGVRSTPTVFVNGKLLRNKSLKGFQRAIDKALKK